MTLSTRLAWPFLLWMVAPSCNADPVLCASTEGGGDALPADVEATDDLGGDSVPGDSAAEESTPWPEWVFRHWIWEGESTQESALAIVDDYRAHGIPVGAIVIDSPWATNYNTFVWDPVRFPNPQGMIDQLHAVDVRVVLWIVSMMNTDVPDLYAFGEDNDYFMAAYPGGNPVEIDWWKGTGSLVDYWGEEAVAWWHGLMAPVLSTGIDGWKCDGTDFSAWLAPYSPGGGYVSRVQYSEAYYRDFFAHTRAELGNDRVIMARPIDNYGVDPGLSGELVAFAPRDVNFAGWVGDQDGDWTGLAAALNNQYYSAQMGYLIIGSDIGGYRHDDSALGRSKELFIRWAQLGALSPLMENGGGGEHRPWMFDEATAAIYRTFTDLHYQLIPYMQQAAIRAWNRGGSLTSYLDKATYRYLLGDDILVAPVLSDGNSIQVTFPPSGRWVYLFDKTRVFNGGSNATLNVPLDEYPVFLLSSSPLMETLTVHR